MAQFEFQYAIFRGEDYIAEGTTSVSLTKKDIKALEEFVAEHAYSPMFVDVPAHIYDKCVRRAWDEAPRLCKSVGEEPTADPELSLSDYILISFIEAMDEEIADKVLDKLEELGPSAFDDEGEDQESEDEEMEIPAPTKENTLYITIKQVYFDQIMDGTKTEEYREIKETTYKKYLEVDEAGYPLFSLDCITEEQLAQINEVDLLYVYNNGVCPFVPKQELWYLNLAVGYNKVRDTALVEVCDITFEPAKGKDGNDARFFANDDGGITFDSEGDLCVWTAVLHLGNVAEKNIVSKKK